MPADELIMRGQTISGGTEVLNFGGRTPGYGYHITEFVLWGSTNLGGAGAECTGTVTADDTAVDPQNSNFDSPGLIANTMFTSGPNAPFFNGATSVINNLFVITQDLILKVVDSDGANPINWQCRFEKVKLSTAAEAVANFNQFTIYDG